MMGSSLTVVPTCSQLCAAKRKRKEDVIVIASGKVGRSAATKRTGAGTNLDTQTANKEADKGGSSVTSSPVHSSHSTKQLPSQSSWACPPNNLKERKWVFLEELSRGGEFTPKLPYLTPPPAKKTVPLLLPLMVIVNIHEL